MSIRKLNEKREAVKARLKAIHADMGEGEGTTEQRSAFDAAKKEYDGLEYQISCQSIMDDMDRRAAGEPVSGSGDRHLDHELRSFSLVRSMAAQAGIQGVDAGRERELSAEIARRSGRSFQGMAVPMSVFRMPVEQRVMTTALPSGMGGSNIIPTDYRPEMYVDLLRNALVVRQLGATVLTGLTGNLGIPRLLQDAVAGFVSENTAIPASDMGFGQMSLTPRHVGALTEFSRTLLMQSSPDIEMLVRQDFAAVLALEIDRAAILGTGTGAEPLGLLNTAGIGSVEMGENGGAISFDALADLVGAVDDANVTGPGAFLTNSKVRRAAAKAKDSEGRPLGLATMFQGSEPTISNAVPSDGTKGTGTGLSTAIYGVWQHLMLGYWSEFDLLVNPFASDVFTKGNVQVRGMATVDVGVRYPEAFAAIRDIAA